MRYVLNDGNPLLCHSVHVKPGNQNSSRIRTGSCIPSASTDNDLALGVLSALVQTHHEPFEDTPFILPINDCISCLPVEFSKQEPL